MTAAARRHDFRDIDRRLTDREVQTWVELRFADRPLSIDELLGALAARAPWVRGQLTATLLRWVAWGHVWRVTTRPATYRMAAASTALADPPRQSMLDRAPAHWTQTRPARQRLWTAARVLRSFDLVSLRMAADVSEERAKDFVRLLTRTNYLRRDDDHMGTTRWAWVERPGPLAPVARRIMVDGLPALCLVDRNTGHRMTVPVRPHRQDRPSGWSPSGWPPSTNARCDGGRN